MYICFWKLCTEKKRRKKKNQLCISKICLHIRRAVKVSKLQKAIASHVEQAERTQRGRKTRAEINTAIVTDELREGEINWQHVKERTDEHR